MLLSARSSKGFCPERQVRVRNPERFRKTRYNVIAGGLLIPISARMSPTTDFRGSLRRFARVWCARSPAGRIPAGFAAFEPTPLRVSRGRCSSSGGHHHQQSWGCANFLFEFSAAGPQELALLVINVSSRFRSKLKIGKPQTFALVLGV